MTATTIPILALQVLHHTTMVWLSGTETTMQIPYMSATPRYTIEYWQCLEPTWKRLALNTGARGVVATPAAVGESR